MASRASGTPSPRFKTVVPGRAHENATGSPRRAARNSISTASLASSGL
jgi:hypothetical protein